MTPELIESEALVLLIEKTGGVLRDVFEVLIVAAEAAESMHERGRQPEPVIVKQNVRYGLNRRKSEYARSISTINLPPEWSLSHEELFARLKELARGPRRVLENDHCAMVLLQSKAVIEYNGEQWFDVHPLVKELLDLDAKSSRAD